MTLRDPVAEMAAVDHQLAFADVGEHRFDVHAVGQRIEAGQHFDDGARLVFAFQGAIGLRAAVGDRQDLVRLWIDRHQRPAIIAERGQRRFLYERIERGFDRGVRPNLIDARPDRQIAAVAIDQRGKIGVRGNDSIRLRAIDADDLIGTIEDKGDAAAFPLLDRGSQRVVVLALDSRGVNRAKCRFGGADLIRRCLRGRAVQDGFRRVVPLAGRCIVNEEISVTVAGEEMSRHFRLVDSGNPHIPDRREVRMRGGRVSRSEKCDGEHLVVLRWPEMKPRPPISGGHRLGIFSGAPFFARIDKREPGNGDQERDQDGERDQQRRKRTSQLHVGTVVTRSPRLSCKSAAALAPRTEISMQPLEPTIRNGPSPS